MTNDLVGAWVKQRRTQLKLGVGTAATRAEISRQTWYSLERGAYPPNTDTQRGVARALRLAPDWYDRLMAGDEPVAYADEEVALYPPAGVREDESSGVERLEEAISDVARRVEQLERALAESERETVEEEASSAELLALLLRRVEALESPGPPTPPSQESAAQA